MRRVQTDCALRIHVCIDLKYLTVTNPNRSTKEKAIYPTCRLEADYSNTVGVLESVDRVFPHQEGGWF